MRSVIIGLGNQGAKRLAIAGEDITATVDPMTSQSQYNTIAEVPVDAFDAAFVCTPETSKLDILEHLLSLGKHVLVEKPLLASNSNRIHRLGEIARSTGAACYTAYNHRFEPHVKRLKKLLDSDVLGKVYTARLFYGNGTSIEIKRSPWRDKGLGVLSDLGSHLLDLTLYLFGQKDRRFEPLSLDRIETKAYDHAIFGSKGDPLLVLEVSYLSWRNTFSIDVLAEFGSAHINGLCKWGPSTFTIRKRVFPSGVPKENVETIKCPDPTWDAEYNHFNRLCKTGGTNIENDIWINSVLRTLVQPSSEGVSS